MGIVILVISCVIRFESWIECYEVFDQAMVISAMSTLGNENPILQYSLV